MAAISMPERFSISHLRTGLVALIASGTPVPMPSGSVQVVPVV